MTRKKIITVCLLVPVALLLLSYLYWLFIYAAQPSPPIPPEQFAAQCITDLNNQLAVEAELMRNSSINPEPASPEWEQKAEDNTRRHCAEIADCYSNEGLTLKAAEVEAECLTEKANGHDNP